VWLRSLAFVANVVLFPAVKEFENWLGFDIVKANCTRGLVFSDSCGGEINILLSMRWSEA